MNVVKVIDWLWQGRSGMAATMQTVLVRLLILVTNIATGVITARALGPEGRGEQAALLLWPNLLGFSVSLGIPSALLYNFKLHPKQKSQFLAAALTIGSVLGLVAFSIGIVMMPYWLHQYSPDAIRDARWFMLVTPIILLISNLRAALEAEEDFATVNKLCYFSPLMTLAILAVLGSAGALTATRAGLAYTIPNLPVLGWMLFRLWQKCPPEWKDWQWCFKNLFNYGLRAYGIDLLGTLSAQIGQVMVVGLLEPKAMGLYVVALSLSRMLDVLHSSIVTVLLPKTAARPVAEVIETVGRAARISLLLTFLAAIMVMILGPILLPLLYGEKFLNALLVLRILLLEIVVSGTLWVLAQAFMALGRPGTVTILQGVGLGLSVPLLLILIPKYGFVGAGLALLLSTIVRLIFVLLSFPIVFKVSPPNLLITPADLQFLLQRFQLSKS
ncbi:MAG: oligosaccharide flippase family protein [Xenococcaceae cyanobacterium]